MSEFKKSALSTKYGKAEIAALIIYIIGTVVIACFHELWFDEAQAWDIARTASYHKILFEVPHYERHPQLWHLLLSVFAKNGAPFKLTIQAVNITISTAAMAVLLFKSPFPKIIRCLLPFTYYFFYQYGVYSRPYCITMLAFFLASAFYKERNEHPWRYILSLTLLCMSTAYGIIISGMLCVVWSIEILTETVKEKKFSALLKDKRIYALCFILIVALFIIISLLPREDTFFGGKIDEKTLKEKTILDNILEPSNYLLFLVFPYESWCGDTLHSSISPSFFTMLWIACVGLLTWALIIAFAKKNKRFFTLILPLTAVDAFMSFKYWSRHHLGIVTMLLLFYLWITLDCEHKIEVPSFISKIAKSFSSPPLKKIVTVGVITIMSMPLYYNIVASFNDLREKVGYSEFADIIKKNHLENALIMSEWQYMPEYDEDGDDAGDLFAELLSKMEIPSNHKKIRQHYTYLCCHAATCAPYFDKNIFMNFNVDCPDETYMHYQYKENVDKVFAEWRAKGLPEFIVGYCPIDEIYDEETLKDVRYLPIAEITSSAIFKDKCDKDNDFLYLREDLFDEYPQFYWIHDPKRNLATKVNNDD